jgi:hypothetical protein
VVHAVLSWHAWCAYCLLARVLHAVLDDTRVVRWCLKARVVCNVICLHTCGAPLYEGMRGVQSEMLARVLRADV